MTATLTFPIGGYKRRVNPSNRDHLADRAPANNEEHRKTCRRQDKLEGQRRHRPMHVGDLGGDREASKNSDMTLCLGDQHEDTVHYELRTQIPG